jgi:hypothetical protein
LEQLIAAGSPPPHPPIRTSTPLQAPASQDAHDARDADKPVLDAADVIPVADSAERTAAAADDAIDENAAGQSHDSDFASKSVRDLKKTFDTFATTSNVSLRDHVTPKQVN